MCKKIFIRAYVRKNLGDDLFVKLLLDRYPACLFYIAASEEYRDIFAGYTNLIILPKVYMNVVYRLINKISRMCLGVNLIDEKKFKEKQLKKIADMTDGTVLIGGSLFMEKGDWSLKKNDNEDYMVNAFFANRYKYVIGANFGPFETKEYYDFYTDIFKDQTDVCFREKLSKNLFADLPNVRNCPDVVFSYKVDSVLHSKNTTGISVIDLKNRPLLSCYENKYFDKLAELVSYKNRIGRQVYLFSFCEEEGDKAGIQKLVERLPFSLRSKVNVEKYTGNIIDFLKVFSAMEEMYASRFHAVILSLLFRQNIYPLIYSDKIVNILSEIDYLGKMCLIEDIGEANISEMVALPVKYIDIDGIRKRAEGQFMMLDKLLG